MPGRFLILWEYRVSPTAREEFEHEYGQDGSWVRFFRQGTGYLGTELLRNLHAADRYLTIDSWRSEDAYKKFAKGHHAEYEEIDRKTARFTISEQRIGAWEVDE